ncbi:MAG: FliM/FliN family flagellar motor switch protein [Ewingella sp.]|uniref:FliM/FliN family flagellar motor switch protein n=1 Tax=Ewingella TaxID=41201 RepID=UPI00336590D7
MSARNPRSKVKVVKYSQTPNIFKLEGNKLGRPYHRLPKAFLLHFDVTDAKLNTYFLRKFRVNATLGAFNFAMDKEEKHAEIIISQFGMIGFDVDRDLLSCILNDYYGLARPEDIGEEPQDGEKSALFPLSRTEERLKSKLALDIVRLIIHPGMMGTQLELKPDLSAVNSQWSYKVSFSLNGYPSGQFHIYLDHHHADLLLAEIRRKMSRSQPTAHEENKAARSIKLLVDTLPLELNARVAQLQMMVAQLAAIKPGDILPVSLAQKFPVFVGKQQLFNALIVEDRTRLYLTEIVENITEDKAL